MFNAENMRPYGLGLLGFVAGTLFAIFVPILGSNAERDAGRKSESRELPPSSDAKANPAKTEDRDLSARGWDANLYMQVSAEYRACCLQAYKLAGDTLKRKVSAAILDEPGATARRDRAVILDLDETVIDNAGYQSYQIANRKSFDLASWKRWEQKGIGEVRLIEGAKDFIDLAKRLNVKVFYITNRTQTNRQFTMDALVKLGIGVDDAQLLCNPGDNNDKTERRNAVARDHDILLLLGDNLRDFDEKYKGKMKKDAPSAEIAKTIQARKDLVNEDRKLWGERYIVFPNPAYGEWSAVLGRKGDLDLEWLVPPPKLDN